MAERRRGPGEEAEKGAQERKVIKTSFINMYFLTIISTISL
jgi:hypothetical protein